MIIDRDNTIQDLTAFVVGLQAAARGLLRLTITSGESAAPQALSTAWLITDSLVVVPDYVVSTRWTSRANGYFCSSDLGAPDPIRAEVVFQPSDVPDGTQPALLRLTKPLPKRALTLRLASVHQGEQVFLLHHPGGEAGTKLSIGRIIGQEDPWLRYDADTQNGSGGGPLLGGDWSVVAMHVGSSARQDPGAKYNEGLSVAALIDSLRQSSGWAEIAAYHGLADVSGASAELAATPSTEPPQPAADDVLLAAAVRWFVDPKTLPKVDRERVAAIVIDSSARRWVTRASERERLIQAASLAQLRAARGSGGEDDPGQRVIDLILAGPPFSVDELEEADLPYWLQAVRWFGPAVPGLPTPLEIHRSLGRRRIRSRLQEVAGPTFRGRVKELTELRDWIADPNGGPIAITGIGGIGKSALVAKLASELPADTVQLWLDFDRADLAPDDPVSVLNLLFEQLALQVDGFEAPHVDKKNWENVLDQVGPKIEELLPAPPVVILDGFEVAQHAPRHEKIWGLLERFLDQVPSTHVIVSGRAPVTGIALGGQPIRNLHIGGLSDEDAAAWLRDYKVKDPTVLKRVLELCRGVPLILRLAVTWLQSGGKVADLPESLPATMVEGFLYRRILDRVVDPELKPLAQDVLVLRRITAEMLPAVVRDRIPKGADPAEVFGRLAREMALVDDGSNIGGVVAPVTVNAGSGVLQLRQEVRAATLRLLETADPKRVRTIDRRAATWYAAQDTDDPAIAAELVYHRLRAGDIAGARRAWREGSARYLAWAEEELPERSVKARAWLRRQTAEARSPQGTLETWEADALARIRVMLIRGLHEGLPDVLAERPQRSAQSVLRIYDAWTIWRAGQLAAARELLGDVTAGDGPDARDRTVLAARLAFEDGDRATTDQLLASIEDVERWKDRPQPKLDALAVTAARVKLTVDLPKELAVLDNVRMSLDPDAATEALQTVLRPSDVVLPKLTRQVSRTGKFESLGEAITLPKDPAELLSFAADLDQARTAGPFGRSTVLALSERVTGPSGGPWSGADLGDPSLFERRTAFGDAPADPTVARGLDLMVLGWRRWRLVSTTPVLGDAIDLASGTSLLQDPQAMAAVGILGAFAGNEWSPFELYDPRHGRLGGLVVSITMGQLAQLDYRPTQAQLAFARRVLDDARESTYDATVLEADEDVFVEATANAMAQSSVGSSRGASGSAFANQASSFAKRWAGGWPAASPDASNILREFVYGGPALEGLGLYLLSPDPLDVLLHRVLGAPDSVEL